jgi:integrase
MTTDLVSMPKHNVDDIIDTLDVSDSTRYEYKQRIKPFLAFVQAEGLTLNVLLEYKRMLGNRTDYSVATRNKYLATSRVFMKECYRLGIVDRDVTSNVRSFKQTQQHKVDGLTNEEVLLICEWLHQHPEKLRERALLCLLLFQGLRQAEICNIRLRDIDLKAGTLFILGKSRDDYERVYLHPNTTRSLRRYCKSLKVISDDYLFTSKRRASQAGKLTTRGLQSIVKGVFEELGIDRTVHGCRHFHCSRLIQAMPGELSVVARFTRHRSLETLKIYDDNRLMLRDVEHYRKAFNDLKI